VRKRDGGDALDWACAITGASNVQPIKSIVAPIGRRAAGVSPHERFALEAMAVIRSLFPLQG
jgi:hypothetical protein